ncbi:NADP-dependent oxidoreductase [Parasphingorhabdus cellanae]|nr:NADP-dependent oxidoreductase [Parasphingorhabdus cellanae]
MARAEQAYFFGYDRERRWNCDSSASQNVTCDTATYPYRPWRFTTRGRSSVIAIQNRRVFIKQRPNGMPTIDDFGVEDVSIEDIPEGHIVAKVDTLSMDAWIRTTLNDEGMHKTGDIGTTIRALGVGQVVETNSKNLAIGDWVYGLMSAQTHALLTDSAATKVEPEHGIEPSAFAGQLGITTGLTAWVGLVAVGEVQESNVVVVSGAAGAVGSVVVQLAKARGAVVIGIAGGPEKCKYLTDTLGADIAIDYKGSDVAEALAKAAPDGVDVFFDNVGGEILDNVLDNLAVSGARVVICGAISQYQHLEDVRGPKLYLRLAERNASMRGFVVSHYAAQYPEAIAEISELMRSGKLVLPEHVVEGIDHFPEALFMLFNGKHLGNLVVKP